MENVQGISVYPNKNNAAPLYLQIYLQIRGLILNGTLSSGAKLPSSRALATQCQVARETVKEAYDLLQAEGFVESRKGAGTFVKASLPVRLQPEKDDLAHKLPLTKWAQNTKRLTTPLALPYGQRPFIDFRFGRSFPHIFPYDVWRKMLSRYLSTDDMMLSRYGSVAGFLPLREAIASYITHHRGVICQPEQIVVVNGAQQALDLLGRLFIDPGDSVVMESPGYTDAYELFQAHGATIVPIPVDDQGLPVEKLPDTLLPKLLFVTPSNQFPHGGAMPAERRLKLLEWAQQRNAYIIEDDYDGALRYKGRPLSALQGIDTQGRVIYLGTFSKVLFPALRLAYIVLPEKLLNPFLQAKRIIDRGAPTLTQAAVADFMAEGHFVRHLRQLRQHYSGLRQQFVTAVHHHLGAQVHFSAEPAGLHLMLYLKRTLDEAKIVQLAAKEGVYISPGRPFHFEKPPPPSLLLGFSKINQTEMNNGLRLLQEVLGG